MRFTFQKFVTRLFWRHRYYATGLLRCQAFLASFYKIVKTRFHILNMPTNASRDSFSPSAFGAQVVFPTGTRTG
jgi:hypothetical protein